MKHFIFFVYTVLSISIGFAQDSSIKGVRLGDHINSRYGEVMPVVSVDGKELYVSRFDPYALSKEVDKHFATFWRSIKQADGTWGPMALIQDIPYFNTGRNRVGFAHLPNGSFLVKGEFQDGIYQHDGFSILAKDSLGNWMNPVGLNIPNYTNLHHYSQASAHMSADGKTLVFYARKDSTVSISKLFVTFEKEGKWTEPLDVGPTINVPNSHVLSPFLCADGKTMYFSSNRLGGLGSNDIFMTKRLDDS